MGTGDKQVFCAKNGCNGSAKSRFVSAYNLIEPGTGVVYFWFFLAGKWFWKWVQVHEFLSLCEKQSSMKISKKIKYFGIYRAMPEESR